MTDNAAAETYVQALLTETREELVRADGKAGLLLAAAGVALGALMGGLLSNDWTPFSLDNRIEWLWWLGALSAGVGLVRLVGAVWPRTGRKGPPPGVVAYYGDVHRYAGRPTAELRAALAASAADAPDRLVDQLREVSRIVVDKYAGVKAALVALPIAAVLCTVAVAVSGALG